MTGSGVPELDDELRRRLGRRFGSAIDAWFDALPAVLVDLAARWEIDWARSSSAGACPSSSTAEQQTVVRPC
jgi:hypothetical protein